MQNTLKLLKFSMILSMQLCHNWSLTNHLSTIWGISLEMRSQSSLLDFQLFRTKTHNLEMVNLKLSWLSSSISKLNNTKKTNSSLIPMKTPGQNISPPFNSKTAKQSPLLNWHANLHQEEDPRMLLPKLQGLVALCLWSVKP